MGFALCSQPAAYGRSRHPGPAYGCVAPAVAALSRATVAPRRRVTAPAPAGAAAAQPGTETRMSRSCVARAGAVQDAPTGSGAGGAAGALPPLPPLD
ncbi:hypothetical protein MNEG_16068, partial [Monoraphidium neglectum]